MLILEAIPWEQMGWHGENGISYPLWLIRTLLSGPGDLGLGLRLLIPPDLAKGFYLVRRDGLEKWDLVPLRACGRPREQTGYHYTISYPPSIIRTWIVWTRELGFALRF